MANRSILAGESQIFFLAAEGATAPETLRQTGREVTKTLESAGVVPPPTE